MDYNRQNVDFQLGLLHFVHLLVTVDGKIDDREREAIHSIKAEVEISGNVFHQFVRSIHGKTEYEVYQEGMRLLSQCSDEEKLSAFVHLYRLAQADEHLDVKEVKLLLYSMKQTNIEFNDIVLAAQLAMAQEQVRNQKWIA